MIRFTSTLLAVALLTSVTNADQLPAGYALHTNSQHGFEAVMPVDVAASQLNPTTTLDQSMTADKKTLCQVLIANLPNAPVPTMKNRVMDGFADGLLQGIGEGTVDLPRKLFDGDLNTREYTIVATTKHGDNVVVISRVSLLGNRLIARNVYQFTRTAPAATPEMALFFNSFRLLDNEPVPQQLPIPDGFQLQRQPVRGFEAVMPKELQQLSPNTGLTIDQSIDMSEQMLYQVLICRLPGEFPADQHAELFASFLQGFMGEMTDSEVVGMTTFEEGELTGREYTIRATANGVPQVTVYRLAIANDRLIGLGVMQVDRTERTESPKMNLFFRSFTLLDRPML